MADHRPTLTIHPNRRPSLLNKHAAMGLAVGLLVPSGIFTLAAPVGLVAGAFFGKHKMKREQEFGKQVDPPSNWNFGTLLGGLAGLNLGLVGGLIAGGVAAAALTGAALPLIIGIGAGLGTMGAVTWVGAKIGKFFQNREYKAAERQVAEYGEFVPQQQQALQQARGRGQGVEQNVAPAMGQQSPMQQPGQPPQQLAQAQRQVNPEQLAQLQALIAQGQRMAPPQPESMTDKVGHSRAQGPQER